MAEIILPPGSTSMDLQTAIDNAVSGDTIIISGDMPFTATVTVTAGKGITIKSNEGNDWVLDRSALGEHFNINGNLILQNITLYGSNSGGGLRVFSDGSLTTSDTTIKNCATTNYGGGVYVTGGTFNMNSGTDIQSCYASYGGGVYVTDAGTFNMSGGIIRESNRVYTRGGGVHINDNSTFTMTGGKITDNRTVIGGGVYIENGVFDMINGEISGNKVVKNQFGGGGQGGGVYLNTGGKFNFSGGEVSNNESEDDGGGVYVYGVGTTLMMTSGIIGGNKAGVDGGGVYSTTSGTVVIGPGSVINNVALNGNGGGIFMSDTTYARLTTNSETVFSGNRASVAYAPPEKAAELYPNIQFASTTIREHPLNNFDINYTGGEPIIVIYNIIYSANGGTGSHTGPDIEPGGTDTVLSSEETGISREGCSFIGWNTSPDGKGTAYTPGDTITLNGNVTLYAQWEDVFYTVTYDANGGTGSHMDTNISYGTEYTVLSLVDTGIRRAGYTFAGWNTEPDGGGTAYVPNDKIIIKSDVILYAQWIEILFAVTYNANGGAGSHTGPAVKPGGTDTVLSLEDTGIRWDGHTFTGWNTGPDGGGIAYAQGDAITLNGNVTLYAQWEEVFYTVTYDANGGTGNYIDTDISYGSEYTVLFLEDTGISRYCHAFTGWNTEMDGKGISYAPGDTSIVRDNVVLYAQWTENIFTVTYHANGGHGSYMDTDIPCGNKYTVLSLKETGISRRYYTFIGWNTKPDGSGMSYAPGDRLTLLGNLTIYTMWKIKNKPDCDEFCCDFCEEFCREFHKGCCRTCYEKHREVCCKICRKICRKLSGGLCNQQEERFDLPEQKLEDFY